VRRQANDRFGAVIFDMDGVLLDSEPLHFAALNDMLAPEGVTVRPEENQHLLGTTVEDTFRWIMDRFALPEPVETYKRRYDERILERLKGDLQPSAGLIAVLDHLTHLGMPLAVASSSNRAWVEATLRSLNIRERFRVVVSGEDVERGKPDPEIYLAAAKLLGVNPDVCLVFEDAPTGIQSAKRAGMKVVALRTPYTKTLRLEVMADTVIDSFKEFHIDAFSSMRDPVRD